jgi:hypothetical protein
MEPYTFNRKRILSTTDSPLNSLRHAVLDNKVGGNVYNERICSTFDELQFN